GIGDPSRRLLRRFAGAGLGRGHRMSFRSRKHRQDTPATKGANPGPEESAQGSPAAGPAPCAEGSAPVAPRHKRFLTDQHARYPGYIKAAKTYLQKIGGARDDWLFLKPFRPENHREYFTLTYNVLNLLEVMRVPRRGRILEVGSGAGWLTEILMGLGYEVY